MSELKEKEHYIIIPKGYRNIGISINNYIFGDTNDSSNWGKFKFPLPQPPNGYKWGIADTEHQPEEERGIYYLLLKLYEI